MERTFLTKSCSGKLDPGFDFALMRKTWTLPILSVLKEQKRFSEIKSLLPAITDRALSQALLQVEEKGWLNRDIVLEGRHPFPIYQTVGLGADIADKIDLA